MVPSYIQNTPEREAAKSDSKGDTSGNEVNVRRSRNYEFEGIRERHLPRSGIQSDRDIISATPCVSCEMYTNLL